MARLGLGARQGSARERREPGTTGAEALERRRLDSAGTARSGSPGATTPARVSRPRSRSRQSEGPLTSSAEPVILVPRTPPRTPSGPSYDQPAGTALASLARTAPNRAGLHARHGPVLNSLPDRLPDCALDLGHDGGSLSPERRAGRERPEGAGEDGTAGSAGWGRLATSKTGLVQPDLLHRPGLRSDGGPMPGDRHAHIGRDARDGDGGRDPAPLIAHLEHAGDGIPVRDLADQDERMPSSAISLAYQWRDQTEVNSRDADN